MHVPCRSFAATCLWMVFMGVFPAPTAAHAGAVEEGSFVLHKYKQPVGVERYTIERSGGGLALHADFAFKDRGTPVALAADMMLDADGAPQRLVMKGKSARTNDVDLLLEHDAGGVRIVDGGSERHAGPAGFLLGGYAPVALQQQLMRRWIALGRPASIDVAPLGSVRIRRSGIDAAGPGRTLTRYVVEGLIWGQESIWLDAGNRLAALIGTDAEFDHFEATREGDEGLLPTLLAAATRDQLASLERSFPLPRPEHGVVALRGALLIDGSGRAPVPDAVVLMRDGRILAAGPRAQVRVPRGARVVDAGGKTVIPGLWDMHAHYNQVEWGPIYLAAGVTTARDMANEFEYIVALKEALNAGRGLGPRLLTSGLIDGRSEATLGVDVAETPAEGEALVRRYKQAGFDQIKVYGSIKPEVLGAVVAEAHRQGLRVAGHRPREVSLAQALDLGMDEITHVSSTYRAMLAPGTRIAPDLPLPPLQLDGAPARAAIGAMASRHVSFDPTLAVEEMNLSSKAAPLAAVEPGLATLPPALAITFAPEPVTPDAAAFKAAMRGQLLQIVGAAHRAGIPIVAGTDQTVPGHSLHRELELYVEAGMTPMAALQAATSVPARVMGHARDAGTIEAGKRADLVVLDANPLDDIRNTRRIHMVVAGGRFFDPAPLWRMAGFTPPVPVRAGLPSPAD